MAGLLLPPVWPEPEAVVLQAEALVRDALAGVSRLRRVVRDLNDANTELKVSAAAPADAVESIARRYRRAADELDLAIGELDRALPPLGARHDRIVELLADGRLAPHVDDEYAAALGRLEVGARAVRNDLASFPNALGRVGEAVPPLRATTDRIVASIDHLLAALETSSERDA